MFPLYLNYAGLANEQRLNIVKKFAEAVRNTSKVGLLTSWSCQENFWKQLASDYRDQYPEIGYFG